MMQAADLRARLLGAIETHRAGRLEEAIDGYREVLARHPAQFDALRLLGAALSGVGRHEEGLAMLERALQLKTGLPEVWALRGDALSRLGRREEAVSSYERALMSQPNVSSTWISLGAQLRALGRPAEALARFERAVALDPRSATLWIHHGEALNELGRHSEAVASYDCALSLGAPRPAEVWHLRGVALRSLGSRESALDCCDRALKLESDQPPARVLRAVLLAELGRIDDAFPALGEAVERTPEDAAAQFNLGMLNLTAGRFEEGWERYEWRKKVAQFSMPEAPDGPTWTGTEPLAGRRLLLIAEQGLGDTIHFCRFAPLLAQQGAQIKLVVQPSLTTLLSSLAGSVDVTSTVEPMPAFDLQCSLLSVPKALGTTLATIPAPVPYLSPPSGRLRAWRELLGVARKPRIGLVCSGSAQHGNDRNRSIGLQQFALLRSLDVEWHLLQADLRESDQASLAVLGIVDHRSRLTDFAETAALASCMDAVVSVDTAVAHLAGALGLGLLLLLPEVPDWRWMLERGDSPWYPSARIFRRPSRGDWSEPLQQVGEALRSLQSGTK